MNGTCSGTTPTDPPAVTTAPTTPPTVTDAPTTPPTVTTAPTAAPTTPPTVTDPPADYPAWSSRTFYRQNDKVSYQGVNYNCIARWSYNQIPPNYPNSWEVIGGTTPTDPPVVTDAPTAVPTAVPTTAPTTPPTVTDAPTTPPTVTDPPAQGVGNVSMSPSTVNGNVGDTVSFSIMVNSGTQRVAAYGMDITYNSSILGSPAVDDGADGFVSAVNTNDPGIIVASGFDASGTGPGSNLELVIVSFSANNSGTSSIGITVNQLVDENTTTIGTPNGIGGSVVIATTVTNPPTVTDAPTTAPTAAPTTAPTTAPTAAPTTAPTTAPTDPPVVTDAPTAVPTAAPTDAPTTAPTAAPTSVPTAVPTDAPPVVSAGSVWIDPSTRSVSNGSTFTLDVHCHSGNQLLAAYGIDLYFNQSIINIDSNASKIVEAGPDGFLAASNTGTAGKVVTSGFDASGVGPGSDLHIVIVHMVAVGSGTSAVDIDVRSFVDDATTTIGTPNGISGSVTVN
jgi:hypothetical protein